jgi:hypothetical protein
VSDDVFAFLLVRLLTSFGWSVVVVERFFSVQEGERLLWWDDLQSRVLLTKGRLRRPHPVAVAAAAQGSRIAVNWNIYKKDSDGIVKKGTIFYERQSQWYHDVHHFSRNRLNNSRFHSGRQATVQNRKHGR